MAGSCETREEQTALRLVNGRAKVPGAMVDASGAGEQAGARAAGVHEDAIALFLSALNKTKYHQSTRPHS